MATYQCKIGDWRNSVEAESPAEAATKAAQRFHASREYFAGQKPAVAVDVDGVEYLPEHYARGETHTYPGS
jgi:hemin uptake protein HemP